ncbi:MAG: trehalose-phosphatase [Pseudomonadota bacterium]
MQIDSFAPSLSPALTPGSPAAYGLVLPAVMPQTALFLDFDGTLAEIASQPELVQVPADLADTLRHLAGRLGGALAIVSGRRLADIDGFLAPLLLPVAAEHGAVQRLSNERTVHHATPDLHDIARVALALAAQHAGLHVEIKSAAIALHYRHAPELESLCLEAMAEAVKRTPGVDLMQGKCVVEIKPAGVSKGTAIQAFMAEAPFAGRVPVFAGDDTTDEAGFAAVQSMGGQGIKVGAGDSLAEYRCASPAMVRQWLQSAFEERAGA